jgi:hypothetical protein
LAATHTTALWQAPSGSTVVAKDFNGAFARTIDFTGWRDTAPGDVLSAAASMLSSNPRFATDLVDGGQRRRFEHLRPGDCGFRGPGLGQADAGREVPSR